MLIIRVPCHILQPQEQKVHIPMTCPGPLKFTFLQGVSVPAVDQVSILVRNGRGPNYGDFEINPRKKFVRKRRKEEEEGKKKKMRMVSRLEVLVQ